MLNLLLRWREVSIQERAAQIIRAVAGYFRQEN